MKRYLALGDSYTIGEGVSPGECWPFVLARLLEARGSKLEAPDVIATTGWTTDELMTALKAVKAVKAVTAVGYDLVTLLIGVNDQYRRRSLDEYRAGLKPLIQYAIDQTEALRSGRSGVIVISLPDWGRTPFAEGRDRSAVAREISSFNAVAAEEATGAGCVWADIRDVQDGDGDPDVLLTADRLHPSALAYEAWARKLLPFAHAALMQA